MSDPSDAAHAAERARAKRRLRINENTPVMIYHEGRGLPGTVIDRSEAGFRVALVPRVRVDGQVVVEDVGGARRWTCKVIWQLGAHVGLERLDVEPPQA
ncbi:PilZ domain-containing protein [Phenylobacterium conjunctum]|uniref:PilZ domain-containing protein n=1 Tax=Phenylobacterium conjunctum TaxID=1298959 RepID=A0ABW3SVQ4_9CAUL